MRNWPKSFLTSIIFLILAFASMAQAAEIRVLPTPDGGLQPRLSVDSQGQVHLLYFKKRLNTPAAREGNLYYRQYDPVSGQFGLPVRVSSQAFAMQTFSIARASMAVGGDGRIHVLWYLPRQSEFLYSRSNTERSRFESQRSLVSENVEGIDAGGEVAALGEQVAIVWGAGDLSREDERTMFTRLSHDSGASFGPELMVSDPALGACACCSMAAEYMDEQDLLIAYRSAIDGIGRHMQLLTVHDVDSEVSASSYGEVQPGQRWEASYCPLSTNDISIAPDGQRWLAFETESRIMQMRLQASGEDSDADLSDGPSPAADPFTETRQKNPAIAVNEHRERLLVWGETISHARGGRLNLRLFDTGGEDAGYLLPREITIPDYSFPAAAQLPGGGFLVLY